MPAILRASVSAWPVRQTRTGHETASQGSVHQALSLFGREALLHHERRATRDNLKSATSTPSTLPERQRTHETAHAHLITHIRDAAAALSAPAPSITTAAARSATYLPPPRTPTNMATAVEAPTAADTDEGLSPKNKGTAMEDEIQMSLDAMDNSLSSLEARGADPDAQATVTDFLDFTEYLPSDMIRSLTLIGKLDEK